MEDFKNIIALLNNPDTLEVGANLAVSQGFEQKVKDFYYAKLKSQNYKNRKFFKTQLIDYAFLATAKKRLSKKSIESNFSNTRQNFLSVIISINNVLFPSIPSNVLPF
jgi:hypothetical protein